ncbi:MAG: DNA internalization-related competence protein ComEC/Rec2 [Actinomycetota bacterium]
MGSWMLPSAAVAFAAGLIGWATPPPWLDPGIVLASGLLALGIGWLAAGRERRGPGALARAGLLPAEHASVEAVAGGRVLSARPVAAAVISLVGVLALGAAWGGFHHRALASSFLARLAPERVTVEAVLRTDPAKATFGWSTVAQVRRIQWPDGAATLRSLVWVSGDEPLPAARRGDRVLLEGSLRVPDDPGFAAILVSKGIPAQLGLSSLRRLGPSSSLFVRTTQSARRIVGRSIERVFPPKEAGLLLGLLLGDDSKLDVGLERDFRASGLSHLLVVSGGNVAMVLAPVLAATTLFRMARWPTFAVGFGIVAFFTILTGAEPSVLRAGVMACLALVGILMGRPRTTASILSAAVLGLLVLDPWLAWSVGFQLSVTATAGMVALAGPLADRFGRFVPKAMATAAGATVSAQLGVTPILLFYFQEVPLVTLPANLAAFPLVAPSLLLGATAAGGGLVWLPLGKVLAAVALLPMRWLELVADHLGKAPVGYLTAEGGPVVLVVGIGLVCAVVVWIRTGWTPPRPATVLAVGCLPVLVWASALGSGPPAGLTVRALDVGQGDAILVTSPGGATILVDGGPDERAVATQLAALGVRRLDAVIATHPHADHVVGLPTVLSRVPVGVLMQPGCSDESPAQTDLDRAVEEEGIEEVNPRAGQVFRVGDLRLDVLSPESCWTGTESDANNDSLVILLSLREDTVLLTGDAEIPAQEWLLERRTLPDVDVLKVPHHGGGTSVPELFEAVRAEVALVSVGVGNDYGHPNAEILHALVASGAEVWRTDLDGTISVTFDGHRPTVESER